MLAEIVEELAPTGVLRAAINMSNFLLVTGKTDDGDPVGVSPDMAGELAKRLGVGLELLKYKTPGEVADDAGKGIWDIGNIGAEPQRAEKIDFTAAYCEIQATYMVPPDSKLTKLECLVYQLVYLLLAGLGRITLLLIWLMLLNKSQWYVVRPATLKGF